MIKAGDFVVHSMEGVCKVKAIVQMPKGREKVSYYQLSSWPDEKTTVYVPVKTDPDKGVRLRKILSKDEVRDVFQSMIGSEMEWISDIGVRQEWMLKIMKEGNPYDMACMTKMLMKKDLEKPLGSRDKTTLESTVQRDRFGHKSGLSYDPVHDQAEPSSSRGTAESRIMKYSFAKSAYFPRSLSSELYKREVR